MTPSDVELLETYARQKSEGAFAQLVGRYVNLVHASAMRQVRDAHLADDVTQAVFIVLARKAKSVRGEYLAGWLLKTARFCAADALKSQSRRIRHEQQAAAMKDTVIHPTESSQTEIAEYLDQALAHLKPTESTAVAMRFLQNQSSAEVAMGMGISQDAAQKIIARALPKLRRILVARGLVLSGTGGLAEFMLAASRHAAPSNFAVNLSTANLTIAKGALKIMFWTKMKTAGAIAAAFLVVGGGMGVVLTLRDGKARAATSMATPAAVASVRTVQPFASPFLKLWGCRIVEPVGVIFNSDAAAPAATVRAYEQEELGIDCAMLAELSRKIDRFTVSVVSSDDGSELAKSDLPNFASPAGTNGKAVAGVLSPAFMVVPEPGDYLIKVDALDAADKKIASSAVPLHVEPLPPTQVMIDDLQADGTIQSTSVLQGLNTNNSPYREGRFMNSDFVSVTKVTDDQGMPIPFTTQHEHGRYIYHYQLNAPVPPGQAVMGSTSATMEGLVTKVGNGLFQYSMDHTPGGNQPVRRIELYRLPPGAKLISTVPADLPHRVIDGQTQIYMETMIPPGGSNLVSFRYRLAQ